jgi:hypothetical protein
MFGYDDTELGHDGPLKQVPGPALLVPSSSPQPSATSSIKAPTKLNFARVIAIQPPQRTLDYTP